MSRRNLFVVMVAALGTALAMPGIVSAQADNPDAYPTRPVQLVIPFATGGPTDILGRLSAEILARELGQPFLAVNVGGAGGTIGALQVARAKPDGHTLMLGTAGTIVNNPNMNRDIGYDPLKDFVAITALWSQPSIVMVRKDGPYASLKDLIADAKKRPGQLNYGSSGVGSFNHMSTEFFSSLAGIKMTHVPYKGMGPALNDLMGKSLDVVLGPVSNLVSSTDRLVGLAISAPKRSPFAPTVPTAAEAGVPGYVYSSWGGLFAPAGTSPRITQKLSATFAKAINNDSVKKRFNDQGVDPDSSTPAEYQAEIAAEFKRGRQLIESIGLKADK